MQRRAAAIFLFAIVSVPLHQAHAGALPQIKTAAGNAVPECATPGRLMEYVRSRNPDLNPRYEAIASEYMRWGEKLGVRWDFAFYQMILETGSLSYKRGNRSGDVKPAQNNFAGLGAIGNGAPGESFKDISTGVRAHLEHLLLYAGEHLDNPVADRTRKVQEWNVLTKWHSQFTRPINFSDMAAQWAPGSGGYARMLDGIAQRFQEFCDQPDPRPEMAAAVRRDLKLAEARALQPSGAELAKRAIEAGKAEDEQRSALGVQEAAAPARSSPMPFKVLNPQPEPENMPAAAAKPAAVPPDVEAAPKSTAAAPPAADTRTKLKAAAASAAAAVPPQPPATSKAVAADKPAPEKSQMKVASAAGAAKPLAEALPPASAGQKCRVWTASYGGQKALIIRSVIDRVVNYTVLDVNDGAEKREADAFIAAYAKDGSIAGEYTSQAVALDKAFELCPEG